jgi:hypothetical protein
MSAVDDSHFEETAPAEEKEVVGPGYVSIERRPIKEMALIKSNVIKQDVEVNSD